VRRLPGWVNRWQWPQRRLLPNASAYLAYLAEAGEKPAASPISIAVDELTFGLDPSLATVVLDDPSVEGLHARLIRQEDGSLRLVDEGSVAGTWVNYTPVASEGQVLEHGDLVHFGRVGFRFTQRDPQHVRKPVITFEEPSA
jgi:pSer/pThr/pTyr-binding forkhead associated (FHA) protein